MKRIKIIGMLLLLSFSLSAQEYNTVIKDDYSIELRIEDAMLHVRISAPTEGWISIGFDPISRMKGADIVIGYVKNNEVFIRDDYGNSSTSHKPDVKGGGSDTIESFSGDERDGVTTLEFVIPLDSGDERDRVLIPGNEYKVIIAYGKKDNFTSYHAYRGSVLIEF